MSKINVSTITNRTGTSGPVLSGVTTATDGFHVTGGRVLIGTTTDPTVVPVSGSTLVLQGYVGSATGDSLLSLQRGQAPADIASGAQIGGISFGANNGSQYAQIHASTDGAGGPGDYPGKIVFSTTADTGSAPTPRLNIDSLGSAQFTGSQSPTGRDTRISQYGSLLVATTGELISNARCSIDAGNGNVISEGNGKFGSTLFAKGGSSGANVFLGLQESPTGGFDPANANVTITAGGSATFSSSVFIGGNADDLVASSKNVSYAGAGPFVSNRSSSSNTAMSIRLNGVDKTLFKSDGKIVFTTGSPGIQFGSSDTGTNITSQTLDDYEEGTWTVALSSSGGGLAYTVNNSVGFYTKIGDVVHAWWYSSIMNINNNGTGSARISGLPFNSANISHNYGLVTTTHNTAFTPATDAGYVATNNDQIVFQPTGSTASSNWTQATGRYLMIHATYKAA